MNRPPLFAPFAGWLIKPDWAHRVIAGAYDSKSPEERRRIVAENPISFLGVTRSPEDLLPDEIAGDDELLDRGASTLSRILKVEAFHKPVRPAVYAYRLTQGDHCQTGLVGAMHVQGLRDGRVLIHENVRPRRARLLAAHLQRLGATSSPVALTYKTDPKVQAVLDETATGIAEVDHVVEGVRHQVWTIGESQGDRVIARLADAVVYVTDGHHRSAAALAGADDHPEDEPFLRTMAVLFSHDHLNVEAFHRVCPDRSGRSTESLIAMLDKVGTVTATADLAGAIPRRKGEVAVYRDRRWWRLSFDPVEQTRALARLDVERLRSGVIRPLLEVDELAENSGVDYVPNPAGIDEVTRRCDRDGRTGFIMYPTSTDDLMAVADAGDLMPPKSSYVAPKPRSGIFLRVLGTGATAHLDPS